MTTYDGPALTVRRLRQRQSFEDAVRDEILAEGFVAHVALVRDGLPIVLPYLYGVGDLGAGPVLLLHGSTGGGLFRDAGADGIPVSVAVTHLDGLVFADSTFDSSANYRSVMIFGHATLVPIEQRAEALWQVSDHLMPGRRAEVREMTEKEIRATHVLQVGLDHASVKVRFDGVGESDPAVWTGVLPLALRPDLPLRDPLPEGDEALGSAPASVTALAATLTARADDRRERLRVVLGAGGSGATGGHD